MKATYLLWRTWQQRINELLPEVHHYQATTLAWFSMGILLARSAVLDRVALVYRRIASTKGPSQLRRLERFLANPAITWQTHYAPLLEVHLQPWHNKSIELILDASPYQGDQQMYLLALHWRHRTLPLIWRVMPLHDKWDTKQWVMLRDRFAQLAPLLKAMPSVTLLADRGLGCVSLVHLCQAVDWHYLLRVEQGACYQTTSGDWKTLDSSAMSPGESWNGAVRFTKEQALETFLTREWQPGQKEPWFLISDWLSGNVAVRHYARRMTIEAVFADWKQRGLFLSCPRVALLERLDRLLLVMSLAWWWLMWLGASCISHGHRSLFDRTDRVTKSLARLGKAWLDSCLDSLSSSGSLARLVPFWHRHHRLVFSLRL
jgi:hypothetical protein